uniref:Uncharacterized protein n=1 Tax=Romanomermis culicivorax TaxID=13658 RepID=A0A915J662_ROMCU
MNDLDLYDEIFYTGDSLAKADRLSTENKINSASDESISNVPVNDLEDQVSINRRLAKNFSTLLQTAKRELSSKDENIRKLKSDIEKLNVRLTHGEKLKQKYDKLKIDIARLEKENVDSRDIIASKNSETDILRRENESLRKKLKNIGGKVIKYRQSKSKPNLVEITFSNAQDAETFLSNLPPFLLYVMDNGDTDGQSTNESGLYNKATSIRRHHLKKHSYFKKSSRKQDVQHCFYLFCDVPSVIRDRMFILCDWLKPKGGDSRRLSLNFNLNGPLFTRTIFLVEFFKCIII